MITGTADWPAYDFFDQSDPMGQLTGDGGQPPWMWLGGAGECFHGKCWYSFGKDNTSNSDPRSWWPAAPDEGVMITNPARYARTLFPWLPELNEPNRYNPYLVDQPGCCTSYPLSAAIHGPDFVNPGEVHTWYARAAGGTPPYTYRWSGAFSGTASSISGSLYQENALYLDIYDATGARIAVNTYIQFPPPPGPCVPNPPETECPQ